MTELKTWSHCDHVAVACSEVRAEWNWWDKLRQLIQNMCMRASLSNVSKDCGGGEL